MLHSPPTRGDAAGRGSAGRGSAGDAARVLAVGAGATGAIGGALTGVWAMSPAGDGPLGDAPLIGPVLAVMSWILAIAASWTALAALRHEPRDRLARIGLRAASPGAIAGAIVLAVLAGWWALAR